MGNFLENVIDWGLSRERYWGTPLPIWTCKCGHIHVIGSIEELKKLGKESKFVDGLRYTDQETMDVVQQVLCGKVNKSLVATLNKLGSKSIGLCGIDGGLMTARAAEGCTGELVRVDSTILETSLAQDYTPVVAAVAQGADGGETVYSVSALSLIHI